jgi:hypothetical protein
MITDSKRGGRRLTNSSQRVAKDELERFVISNINDFGWHAVNVIEDDGQPPWTLLRLAGLFGRPALARHRRSKGVTLTRLTDSVRYHFRVVTQAQQSKAAHD